MFKLMRIATCDFIDCDAAIPVQGDDDAMLKAEWVEVRKPQAVPTHLCPAHAATAVIKSPSTP